MEPARIGTPTSPAGRRRYKHRSALSCSAPVSGAHGTNPHWYTNIAGGTPALQASQRPFVAPPSRPWRWNQPASVHHHRRRDAGATSIAAPFVAPPSRDGTPHRYTTIAGGRRRSASQPSPSRARNQPAYGTRAGTPPLQRPGAICCRPGRRGPRKSVRAVENPGDARKFLPFREFDDDSLRFYLLPRPEVLNTPV